MQAAGGVFICVSVCVCTPGCVWCIRSFLTAGVILQSDARQNPLFFVCLLSFTSNLLFCFSQPLFFFFSGCQVAASHTHTHRRHVIHQPCKSVIIRVPKTSGVKISHVWTPWHFKVTEIHTHNKSRRKQRKTRQHSVRPRVFYCYILLSFLTVY